MILNPQERRVINTVYNYEDVPTIARFAASNARHRGLMGPFGSGKSSGCAVEVVRRAHMQSPSPRDGIRYSRVAIVRNTYPQLRDTTIKTFKYWFPPSLYGEYRVADHDYIIHKFPGVFLEVLFRALDRPDQVDNLLSLELTGAWINEAREIPKEIFDAIDGRINRYPAEQDGGCSFPYIIADTNPPNKNSWWFKYFEGEHLEDVEIFKQPSGRSPFAENLRNLPKGYYTKLARGKTEDFNRVYVDGQYGFTSEGKPVYGNNWNDATMVATHVLTPMRGLPVILSFDFGLTPACVFAQLSPSGKLLVLDELVSSDMGIESFAKNMVVPLLALRYEGIEIRGTGDPAGMSRSPTDESTCYDKLHEIFRDLGIRFTPAITNALTERVGAVEAFLRNNADGWPAFVLSRQCAHLRDGFNGGYRFKRMRTGMAEVAYAPEPEKNMASHIHDALQYACMYVSDLTRRAARQRRSRVSRTAHVPATIAGY
jgi:hypothetical protein